MFQQWTTTLIHLVVIQSARPQESNDEDFACSRNNQRILFEIFKILIMLHQRCALMNLILYVCILMHFGKALKKRGDFLCIGIKVLSTLTDSSHA